MNDPQTKHIGTAAYLLGRFHHYARRMVSDRSLQRSDYFTICTECLDELKVLNQQHFNASTFIAARIAELEKVTRELSQPKTWTPDEEHCPTCGTRLENLSPGFEGEPACAPCLFTIYDALEPLKYEEGFKTWGC